ncbi:hypothetical protein [Heliophilum fasciatum]|uniref:Uncharacterized protein n=1 Tax=Heliophilum fasciatum TaxID=35700 RepID=A0A4R2RQX1_9FIRM|nr:hypothetical protein [Heliophilum fasciatum]MCW2277530.1 hypothetical protein [Heliophilum fasciatum]TCP65179.1 hypothetical protein EDD73_10662 [Heliophilum fasciatum]
MCCEKGRSTYMMCDHLRQMVGQTFKAEVRTPQGETREYQGRLVAVGDDFIELETESPTPAQGEDVEIKQFGRGFGRVILPTLLLTSLLPYTLGGYGGPFFYPYPYAYPYPYSYPGYRRRR